MTEDPANQVNSFDPVREAGYAGIKILERPDGGREFILPATRNFSEKLPLTFAWLILTAVVVVFALVFAPVINELPLPGVIRFFILNHVIYFFGILGLFDLVFGIACVDMWLRSSRVIASAGQLQTVTHWLFIRRAATVFADRIIEIRVDPATTINTTVYYDILVITVGSKPGWMAKNFPAKPRPGSSFTENDLKSFNSGGKKLRVATGIEGQAEANWFAAELRRLLKLDNSVAPSSIKS